MAFLWLRSRANQKPHKANSSLFLDEASAVCQARTPQRRRMRIRSENSLCRLWDFERPRPQIPIPRHRKGFVVVCCCVYREPGRGGARALHASRRRLATGCAGGGRPNARTRDARCILTTRRDGADRARRDGVDHARRDGADRARRDGDRRGNGQQPCGRGPRAPGCDCDCGPAGFRPRAGVNFPGVSLGGPRGYGAILRDKLLIGHGAIHRKNAF